jgi:hypothetical protein
MHARGSIACVRVASGTCQMRRPPRGRLDDVVLACTSAWQAWLCHASIGCTSVSLDQVFRRAGLEVARIYTVSGGHSEATSWLDMPAFAEWLSEAPASAPLFAALGCLALFYAWLLWIEA